MKRKGQRRNKGGRRRKKEGSRKWKKKKEEKKCSGNIPGKQQQHHNGEEAAPKSVTLYTIAFISPIFLFFFFFNAEVDWGPSLFVWFAILIGPPEKGVVRVSVHAWNGTYHLYHTVLGGTTITGNLSCNFVLS